jgi:hypothetical protein
VPKCSARNSQRGSWCCLVIHRLVLVLVQKKKNETLPVLPKKLTETQEKGALFSRRGVLLFLNAFSQKDQSFVLRKSRSKLTLTLTLTRTNTNTNTVQTQTTNKYKLKLRFNYNYWYWEIQQIKTLIFMTFPYPYAESLTYLNLNVKCKRITNTDTGTNKKRFFLLSI